MVRVKICGITNVEDAMAAAELGADALGFVFAPSPRRVAPERAREIIRSIPPLVWTVGVFVNAPLARMVEIRSHCGLDMLQIHGEETEEMASRLGPRVIKAVRVRDPVPHWRDLYPEATLLLDAFVEGIPGGTGRTFDWSLAQEVAASRRIILAGGLTPANVRGAVALVHPYAVDVSSGVEREPGRKDHARLEEFIRNAKSWDGASR